MKHCLSIAIFFLLCQLAFSQPQYSFRHFTTKDGLMSDKVRDILQDSLGFIWFFHSTHLTRYDGYNFKVYIYDPGDSSRLTETGLMGWPFLDRSGNLWINNLYLGGFLLKYDRRSDRFIKYSPNVRREASGPVYFDKDKKTIWLPDIGGRGFHSFNTETFETNAYLNFHTDSLIHRLRNSVGSIHDRGLYLLLCTRQGLWKFDKATKIFSRPECKAKDSTLLYNFSTPSTIDWASYHENWLSFSNVLVEISSDFDIVQQIIFPPGLELGSLDRDQEGVFWIPGQKGLYRYDHRDSSLLNFGSIPDDPQTVRSNLVTHVAVDKEQNVWVSTFGAGVSRLTRKNLRAYTKNFSGQITASTMYHADGTDYLVINKRTDENNEIWSAAINGLDDLQFKQVEINTLTKSYVTSLLRGQKYFWIGTNGDGITGLPVNDKGSIERGPPLKIRRLIGNVNSISNDYVKSIFEDADKNLWVASLRGVDKINPGLPYGTSGAGERGSHLKLDKTPLPDNTSFSMTTENMRMFSLGSFAEVDFAMHSPICNASDGAVFIGTMNGVYEGKKDGRNYKFGKVLPLRSLSISSIQEDTLERLWITAKNRTGLLCYDRKEQILTEFSGEDGFEGSFGETSLYKTSKGMMVVVSLNDIYLFDPSSLKIDRNRIRPVLTALKVNNIHPLIYAGNQNAPENFSIPRDITLLDELVLDYRHTDFSIEFSAMEMVAPERNLYRHKLEGYDKNWTETDWKNRTATYTNLDPGTYIFKVVASNHHGVWSNHETSLNVRILPPPWKTWWAYSIYGLLVIGLILYWRRYEIKRVRLKQRAEYLGELDSLKTRFFANISHEFRTPITLILGPLREFYNGTFKGDQKAVFGIMLKNGQRLLRLINQLLDLSKLEAGKMQLHTVQVDMVEFLREIAASYESLAADKKIKYGYYPEVAGLKMYVDKEKIEKIVHNLLSNAFKFTTRGEITLRLNAHEKQGAAITVQDTGIGIPKDQMDKVFDRFYQVDSSQTRGYEGSGLGMALAKELVELHHGKILIESTEGIGTTFTVWIPSGEEPGQMKTIARGFNEYHQTISEDPDLETAYPSERENGKPVISSEEQSVILIVEDNTDMRNFIRKTLLDHHHIIEAANGKDGLKKAQEIIPDLIISDIMMPEMDGYKLCELIKTNELTSHIPVILLTAKADRESKLAGLETGADDYLSKPFDADELKLIIRNRIDDRRKMRERFSREITLEPRQIAITSLDEKFLNKVLAIIEVHMDDENFSIVELSREAGYSHIHFYRKIKALSGRTPNLFLRTIRLKRAAELLRNKSDNVSQIAFSVGFSSQSYFIKCFKEQFGVTPGEFVEDSQRSKV